MPKCSAQAFLLPSAPRKFCASCLFLSSRLKFCCSSLSTLGASFSAQVIDAIYLGARALGGWSRASCYAGAFVYLSLHVFSCILLRDQANDFATRTFRNAFKKRQTASYDQTKVNPVTLQSIGDLKLSPTRTGAWLESGWHCDGKKGKPKTEPSKWRETHCGTWSRAPGNPNENSPSGRGVGLQDAGGNKGGPGTHAKGLRNGRASFSAQGG